MTCMLPSRVRGEEREYNFISELRNNPNIVGAIKRGLEARRNGERIHWNDVKTELGIA